MKLRHILQLALLETKRKKKTYSVKTLLFLIVLITIFFGTITIVFQSGVMYQQRLYDISTEEDTLKPYLVQSAFTINPNAPNTFFENNGKFYYRYESSLRGRASASALRETLTQQNYIALYEQGINPLYLVYVNITNVAQNPTDRDLVSLAQNRPGQVNNIPTISELDEMTQAGVSEDSQVTQTPADTQITQNDQTTSVEQENTQQDNVPIAQPDSATQQMQDQSVQPTSQTQQFNGQISPELEGLQTPNDISSFAFVKDLLVFIQILFVLNVASGLFGTAILREKMNQKSSLLFLANIKPWEFVIGKALVYFVGVYILFLVIFITQYPQLLIIIPIHLIAIVLIILYLSISCVNGFLARNHKEYSFLSVFSITTISLYLLIPAFLSNISELSYASLLTPFALYAQGEIVNTTILFFVIPIYGILGTLIFYICTKAWDYETLYMFEPPFTKLLRLIANAMTKTWQLLIFGMGSVAFAWICQLLLVAVFVTTNLPAKMLLFLLVAAIVEEYFRNLGIHALYKHNMPLVNPTNKNTSKIKTQLMLALFTGLGFMIAEKGFLVLTIAPYLSGFELLVLSGLVAPFLLHSALTFSFIQMRENIAFFRNRYWMSALFLGLIHAAINIFILQFSGVIA